MSHSTQEIKNQYKRFVKIILLATIFCCLAIVILSYILTENMLLVGVLFVSFILVIFIITSAIYSMKRVFASKLFLISQLEDWANLSKVRGEIKVLPHSDDNLTQTINSLVEQLEATENEDNQFDRKLLGNALLDKETGVGNRDFFNNRLEELLKEEDIQGAVYFIQFKECELVRTLYGQQQALALIEALISTLNDLLTPLTHYFLARRSEFELAVIVPHIFFLEAENLAEKLVLSLSKVDVPVGVNKDAFIHIGVSYFSNAENSYQVKSETDMALRSAQLQGPSQWFMFDPGEVEHTTVKGSLNWLNLLKSAIEKNAFVIFFQPVFAIDSEQQLHHEALSKVRDFEGNLIDARVFLPMAQKCGLIKDIDLLMFEQVCRLLSYDNEQQDDCSLNLSIESLLAKGFIEKITEILLRYQTISTRLIIEVSEYHLVNHLTELKPILSTLHQLGINLLVDKVGQYIESADYIKSYPISYMKLHRSIVLNIDKKPENQIFVQSVIAICGAHKVDVYALGVESIEEWKTLIMLGIDGGQGHYFTEPVAQVAKAIYTN